MMTDGDREEIVALIDHLEIARNRAMTDGRLVDQMLFNAAIMTMTALQAGGAPVVPPPEQTSAAPPPRRGRPRKGETPNTPPPANGTLSLPGGGA